MTVIKLKHIDRFTDRHGRVRYYFRRDRGARIPLPGSPGSPEFMAAYEEASRGVQPPAERRHRGLPGTFDRLLEDYFSSPDFLSLNATSTQRAYRRVMENWVRDEKIGHRLVREMRREHVSKMLARRAETPGAANDLLKKIRIHVRFVIVNGIRRDDPTLKMRKFKGGEFHTWTEEETEAYERHWPIGSRERLAFALLLYTGQRVGDDSTMCETDLATGRIKVVQIKTDEKLEIPLHPMLAAILKSTPITPGMILKTSFGNAFTQKGLANFMADAIGKAGLPDRCVTHGLRKAAARRLAEAGCSVHEIMAITGHRTLAEVERYTKAAEQKRLAQSAIDRLSSTVMPSPFPNLSSGLGKAEEKPNNISDAQAGWRTVLNRCANTYVIEVTA